MKKIIFFSFILSLLIVGQAKASNVEIESALINSQSFFNQEFNVFLEDQITKDEQEIVVKKFNSDFRWPWNFKVLSAVYEFDLTKSAFVYNNQLINLEIKYVEDNPFLKQIFFWDNNLDMWRPLPSVEDFKNKTLRASIHLPYARLALFYNPKVLISGEASWYRFKNGFFAASPDFPKDSVIRVKNLNNDSFVDVKINDYGPNRAIFPKRVIDLDWQAFKEIANPKDGLIDVHLEPIYINESEDDYTFKAQKDSLSLNAQSFIIAAEDSSNIIAEKNSQAILPIASLTKLLSIKVFLDTKPNLNKEVFYLNEDELFNHQFVMPWESARLKLQERESLTIKDLLFSTVVMSANNSLETLVRVSGLSRTEFINRMNIYARNWGAINSNFVEPTGLSKDNISTALDYAIIVKEVLKDDFIREIIKTENYSFSTINTQRLFKLKSNNQMIKGDYKDVLGSKTGFINASGFCLFTRLKVKDKYYNIISLNSSSRENSFSDHLKARDYLIQTIN